MTANTIDEVITQLESIVKESISVNDRAGYFAALYYKVTVKVKEGIANGEFENGPRMEHLDVTFANRYLEAYNAWKKKEPVTGSWKLAFDATKKDSPLVLQHLLLGMNAHINLDLGIAAAATAGNQPLESIHHDFNSINTIISSLTYQLLNEISRISPLLSLLGLHSTNYTSVLIQFSIDNARDGAWCFADELSNTAGTAYIDCIQKRDGTIKLLGDGLLYSKGFLRFTLFLIHLFEWKKPSKIIKVLYEFQRKRITINKD